MPQELTVFLTAMTPLGELRAALPLALLGFKMSLFGAYIISVLGNMVPVFFLLLFYRYLAEYLMKKFVWAKRFFGWLFERTRKNFKGDYEKWGKLALMIFVAIPFPMTGAWSGALVAWLFGFRYWESIFFIFMGVCLAGAIVGAVVVGGSEFFKILFVS
ncbi:small multi-drug export protein [Candidatus Kuenenbacteria bacterium]|nr:small multi-drug export protein [Candidatus Kuenenbacteria bacterium]